MFLPSSSFEKRRFILGIFFLIKSINNIMDSPALPVEMNLNIPNGFSRNFIFIKRNRCRHNYELFNPFKVLYKNLNDIYL